MVEGNDGKHPYGWNGNTTVYTHRVVKRNGRLCLLRTETGEIVYTPPDFLRPHIRDRAGMVALARRLDYQWFRPIAAIMEFEGSLPAPGTRFPETVEMGATDDPEVDDGHPDGESLMHSR